MAEPLQLLIKSAFDAVGVTAAINSVNSIDRQINNVSRGFSKFMGLLGMGGIGAGVLAFGKSSVMAFAESEKSVAKLNKAMQNLGDFTQDDLRIQTEFAKQLQKTTIYSDEQIMSIQTQLTTYGLYGDKLKEATAAALDLTTRTGSVETATKILGKAFQGNTTQLAKLGIKIDDTATGAKKFELLLKAVREQLGGMAEVEGKSFEGQMTILNHRFEEIKETIGKELMPVSREYLKWLEDFAVVLEFAIPKLMRFYEAWKKLSLIQKLTPKGWGLALLEKPPPEGLPSPVPAGTPGTPKKGVTEVGLDLATAQWVLDEKHKMMEAYYRRHAVQARKWETSDKLDEKDRVRENKKTVNAIEEEWNRGSREISTGFEQALLGIQLKSENWAANWTSLLDSTMSGSAGAIKGFLDFTGEGFLKWSDMFKGIMDSILQAFLDMVSKMIAKWLLFEAITAVFGAPGGKFVSKFFQKGGPVLETGVYGLHGGEFVLSSDIVNAIRRGTPTAGLPALAGAAGMGGVTMHQTVSIGNLSSELDVNNVCKKISEAARRGVTAAVDAGKVLYKVGKKREGETSL